METGKVLDPREVSRREWIFERDGVLRWRQCRVLGYGVIGVDLQSVLKTLGSEHASTGSFSLKADLSTWLDVFDDCGYLLWLDETSQIARIVLKRGATARDQLEAWTHGLLLARESLAMSKENSDTLGRLQKTRINVKRLFEKQASALEAVGWDLESAALETRSGKRIEVGDQLRRHVAEEHSTRSTAE